MCHCCRAEGHLSIESDEKCKRDEKDWHVNKAINAHQHETNDNNSQNSNNGDQNNTNANNNDANNSRSAQ